MNTSKKIEMQEKIIHRLQEENKSLLERNLELEKKVDENQKIIEEANKCREKYYKLIASLNDAKETYLQAVEDIYTYKKNYRKEMEGLLRTVKKNT